MRLAALVVVAVPEVVLAAGWWKPFYHPAMWTAMSIAIAILGAGHLIAAFISAWRQEAGAMACWAVGVVGAMLFLFGALRAVALMIVEHDHPHWDMETYVVVVAFVINVALVAYRLRRCVDAPAG